MIRTKRSKQYSYDELKAAVELFNNDKKKIAEYLELGQWSLREQLKRNNLNIDKRVEINKSRKKEIPNKEELEELYYIKNLTLLDISKIYEVSNVTVKKWFKFYNLNLLSHSDNIKLKIVPKIIATNNKKYGVDFYYQTKEFKCKSEQTLLDKYGVPFYPFNGTSNQEVEVLNFFNSLDDSFNKDKIHNTEIDGVSLKLNIGFEYCGLYWHTETKKGKNSHVNKYKICDNLGIRLFTIFEDEWVNRNKQVKNFIKASLGKFENKIFARNLKFKKCEYNDLAVITFINDTHIQGISNLSNIINHYILHKDGIIYACITIGKHHRNPSEIVLSRCCIKNGYNIIGGTERLFHYVKNDYKGIIIKSWSDNRWTQGNLYLRLGFELERILPIDYSYVFVNGKLQRKSKQSMKKSKIGAVNGQTEYEKALELGYDRIWDCGKKVWIFK